jgi:hypothetical protein
LLTISIEAFSPGLLNVASPPTSSKNIGVLYELFTHIKFFNRCTFGYVLAGMGIPFEDFDVIQLALSPFAFVIEDAALNVLSSRGRLDYDISVIFPRAPGPHLLNPPVQTVEIGGFSVFQHDGILDLFTLLQVRNFWKRHMCWPGENTYFEEFRRLPKPQMFDGPLKNGFKKLGRRWEGFWGRSSYNLPLLVWRTNSYQQTVDQTSRQEQRSMGTRCGWRKSMKWEDLHTW